MKVLVIGSGGREHALVWQLKQSPEVETVYCAPGNAGIAADAECVDIGVGELEKLADFAEQNHIDLTVGDITRNSHPSLPLDITAANFGNVSDSATAGDFAAGAVNMVLQSIGTTAVMACRACGCETVVLTGFMSNLPQAEECFALFTRLHGIRFITPEHATFATSIGAALCSFRDGE